MRYRVDTPRRINRRPPPKSSRLAKPTERRRFTARNSILAHCLAPTPTNPANAHYCRPEKSHGVRLRSHSGRHETGSKPGGCGIDEYHVRRKVERIGLNDQDVGHLPWYDPEIEHAPRTRPHSPEGPGPPHLAVYRPRARSGLPRYRLEQYSQRPSRTP